MAQFYTFQRGKEIGMWYAQRQRGKTSQKAKRDHHLYLSNEQKSLLQRLVDKIDQCSENKTTSSSHAKLSPNNQKSKFMENYHPVELTEH